MNKKLCKNTIIFSGIVLSLSILLVISIFIIRDYFMSKNIIEDKIRLFDKYNAQEINSLYNESRTDLIKNKFQENSIGIIDIIIINNDFLIRYSFNEDLIGKHIDYDSIKNKYKVINIENLTNNSIIEYKSDLFIYSFFYSDYQKHSKENIPLYILYDVKSIPLNLVKLNMLSLLLPILVLLIIMTILFLLITGRFYYPLKKVNTAFRELSKGNLSINLKLDNIDGTQEIFTNFNNMIYNLQERFKNVENKNKEKSNYAEFLKEKLKRRNTNLHMNNNIFYEELRMAQRLQLNLIPDLSNFPRKELKFSAKYMSMDKVGGDLYDVIRVGKNGYGILIADASGHGVPASLLASMAKVSFINHSGWGILPSKVCEKVNKDFLQFIGDLNYFLTAYYGIMNLETGYFTYTSAGHMPAILYKAKTGQIEELKEGRNPPIGTYISSKDFSYGSVLLEKNDRIILYTDGIIEARNPSGEFYTKNKLLNYVKEHGSNDIDKLINGIILDVENFCERTEQKDDQAVLCVEFISKVKPADVKKT